MRAVSTKVSPGTAAGGFILPDDRVDLMMTRTLGEDEEKEYKTEPVLTNIRVLAIDQIVQEKDGQSVVVGKTVAQQVADRMTLALRSLSDASESPKSPAVYLIGRDEDGKDLKKSTVSVVRYGTRKEVKVEEITVIKIRNSFSALALLNRFTRLAVLPLLTVTVAMAMFQTGATAADKKRGLQVIKSSTVGATKNVSLGLDKSLVVELPRDVRDVLVANPEIADAIVRTARKIFLIGNQVGQTNIFMFDKAGNTVLSLNLAVERDILPLAGTSCF